MLALILPASPDGIDHAAAKLVSKLFPTDQNRKKEQKTASVRKKLTGRTLSLLLRLLILGLVGLGLTQGGRRALLRLDVLVVDSHGLVDLGDESGLILEPGSG